METQIEGQIFELGHHPNIPIQAGDGAEHKQDEVEGLDRLRQVVVVIKEYIHSARINHRENHHDMPEGKAG